MPGLNSARLSARDSSNAAFSGVRDPGVRDFLIRGCQKVIDHYERLLSTATSEQERQLYRARIEREQRLMDGLRQGAFPDRFAA